MKNIIDEKPDTNFRGRMLETIKFVSDEDIQGKRILDIGCGYGWCELNFLERRAARIVASEVSESDLETIRKNISDPKVEYLVASAIDLPNHIEPFDTVVSWEVIEHIPSLSELKMFENVNKVLKDGGIFYLSTPYRGFFSTILDPAWWLIGHRHYDEKDMENFAKQTRFKVEEVRVKGGFWSIFSILSMYISKWVFRSSPPFSNFVSNKIDEEFQSDKKGSVNLFVKFRKQNA